ncbi:MAG: metallophosphoesterase [Cyclobacteriaceae bacterium]|nr:metallophosphoesterase [Cyclobacteriaceae bacterium]MDH4298069.1 metallophosphoesterase [Cyclobacteriaceae bacterium]MDH5250014.1 metallophosphoesterase [Cyclobacteriaceae bacterium]
MTNTINTNAIDFIGDIHGHASELEELLRKLHYRKTSGYHQHPTRKAFFVGDFIDRGPQIREVLEIVKPMVDNGAAYAVIGNHEYNAICYWTTGADGKPLRKHTEKNRVQHRKTIDAFGDVDAFRKYVEWFKTLPIYIEHEHFKSVHAQWNQEHINHLRKEGIVNFTNPEFLINSGTSGTAEYEMIECLLKGEELEVPGVPFMDKDGNERFSYRLKWWLRGANLTCKESLFEFSQNGKDDTLPLFSAGYDENEVPVFFGHYWLKDDKPYLQQHNVCCLDFSVAKEGFLVAYSWDGERALREEKFKYVRNETI